jgi:hypothetical protein
MRRLAGECGLGLQSRPGRCGWRVACIVLSTMNTLSARGAYSGALLALLSASCVGLLLGGCDGDDDVAPKPSQRDAAADVGSPDVPDASAPIARVTVLSDNLRSTGGVRHCFAFSASGNFNASDVADVLPEPAIPLNGESYAGATVGLPVPIPAFPSNAQDLAVRIYTISALSIEGFGLQTKRCRDLLGSANLRAPRSLEGDAGDASVDSGPSAEAGSAGLLVDGLDVAIAATFPKGGFLNNRSYAIVTTGCPSGLTDRLAACPDYAALGGAQFGTFGAIALPLQSAKPSPSQNSIQFVNAASRLASLGVKSARVALRYRSPDGGNRDQYLEGSFTDDAGAKRFEYGIPAPTEGTNVDLLSNSTGILIELTETAKRLEPKADILRDSRLKADDLSPGRSFAIVVVGSPSQGDINTDPKVVFHPVLLPLGPK